MNTKIIFGFNCVALLILLSGLLNVIDINLEEQVNLGNQY